MLRKTIIQPITALFFLSLWAGSMTSHAQNTVQQLTDTPYDERYPSWSPDGTRIV